MKQTSLLNLSQFLSLFCVLGLTTFASNSFSQDWYEIEVIIFEHYSSNLDSTDVENWSRDLDLSWPSRLLDIEPAIERAQPAAITPAFEALPFDQRRMNNDSYALRARDPYELLWHRAWKAPLLPEDQAPWILVQASDELGDHHRLEGAIRIHLSRYLHLHTNFWLTEVTGDPIIEEVAVEQPHRSGLTDDLADEVDTALLPPQNAIETGSINSLIEEVEAQSEFDWSQLPKREGSVRWGCNYVREKWPEDLQLLPIDYYEDPAPADWYHPFGCRIPSEIPNAELPISLPIVLNDLSTESLLNENDVPYQNGPISSSQLTNDLLNNHQIALIPPEPKVHYLVEEIVHIEDSRRMRSGEYHYIDHPKIGVLAIIHPVEKPKLEEEAEVDTELDPEEALNEALETTVN